RVLFRSREAADDDAVVFRDEDRRVRVAPDRSQVAALVDDVAPAVGRHEPSLRLGADGVAELLEALRVGRLRAADDHSTTTPAPPRRGSPAAASFPPSSVTAAAPPKKRLRRRHRVTFQPICSSLPSSASSWPPSQWRFSPSRWTRGRSI